MIYFDNAATTFPKPKCVISDVRRCIEKYCGNPGRGAHRLSVKTSEAIYETREKISSFLGTGAPEKIVFIQNATYALNIAIKTSVEDDSHVLISDMEHNAVRRPVGALSRHKNVSYSIFDTSDDIEKEIESKLNKKTKCIICTLASNVIGREISIKILSDIAKKHKLKLILDASQILGHKKLDLSDIEYSALCAPSHKGLFGIQGAGIICFKDEAFRESIIEGGSGSDSKEMSMPSLLPERFEPGTLSSPAIISILSGIKYIEKIGIYEIENKISQLTERIADMLRGIPNAVLYEYGNGIVSFNIVGVPCSVISEELDNVGICTRSGLHCAPLAHEANGTLDKGTVRVSLSYMNKKKETDLFYKSVKYIANKYV